RRVHDSAAVCAPEGRSSADVSAHWRHQGPDPTSGDEGGISFLSYVDVVHHAEGEYLLHRSPMRDSAAKRALVPLSSSRRPDAARDERAEGRERRGAAARGAAHRVVATNPEARRSIVNQPLSPPSPASPAPPSESTSVKVAVTCVAPIVMGLKGG